MSDQQQTLSIPSLLLLAAFTALTIRYFFFTKSSPTASRGSPRTANPADVEQIAMMFPQIERRAIIWDLQRPMGSAAATTERILGRGSLDTVCAAPSLSLDLRTSFAKEILTKSICSHLPPFNPVYQHLQRQVLQAQHQGSRNPNT